MMKSRVLVKKCSVHPAHAKVSEIESFTIESVIKGYHIYNNASLSFGYSTIAVMKDVQKDL